MLSALSVALIAGIAILTMNGQTERNGTSAQTAAQK
jgi:hypothetical protein